MSPRKATEILNTLISDAAYLESEPFESSKRSQWTETSRAVLKRAFDSNSSILDSFGTAQSISFGGHDTPEQLRQHANATLSSTVAVLRSAVEQLRWEIEDSESTGEVQRGSASGASVPIFISHSSKDLALATALVDLFRSGLGLTASQIRCSSVDGYRLPVGVNTESKLREEVNAAKVVVGLITPSSLASYFVMFELGARWGTGSFLAPLLAGVKPDALMGPLSLLNALSATSESQLHQLLGDIAGQLDLPLQSAASYQRDLAAVKGHADAIPSSAVTQAGPPVAPFPKLSLTAEGTPPSQVLKLSSSQRIGVIHVEYLLCDDTCIVSNDISLDGESFDVPLNYESLTKLWNTPRADRNRYDHSGPAKIALTVTVNGVVRQLMLPVRMESLMRNNTFFINVAGSKTFYSGL